MRFTFRLLAVVAAVALSVGASNAAPITSTDGIAGDAFLKSDGSTFTLNFGAPGQGALDTATTKFNGALLVGIGPIPTFLAGYEFSAVGVVGGGGTTYAFQNFIFAITKQLLPTLGQGAGSVDFSLNLATAFVPDVAKDTMIVSGTLSLLGNTSAFDFSPYLNGGQFRITFNATPGINLNNVITSGNTAEGTASFSTSANAEPTPEPASMILFGVLAVGGGLAVARRKLLARRAATA